ncbi:MAG: DNA/RNA nuclease SfsA [Pseudomonadota bacterium]
MHLPPLTEGRLIKRYKRFLADVELVSGGVTTVHCPNPGSLMGLKDPGMRVWMSTSHNPKRKLPMTLELVEADGGLVSVNTNNPNKLAEEAIRSGKIVELAEFDNLRREVRYSTNSRIDILLESEDLRTYVEVKNCHLMRTPGLTEFPDSVTSRGAKHLRDLMGEKAAGNRAVMLFIIQRSDCNELATAPDVDMNYHEAFYQAADAGVEILCYDCQISLEEICVRRRIPWRR